MTSDRESNGRVESLVGPDLAGRIVRWMSEDPDEVTTAEVSRLIAIGDAEGLRERFERRLEFGTAGLRGALGAGPNRMNRLVVRHAAAGLMAHLGPGARVVVGHDARHGSASFAADTARVIAASGGTALVLPGLLPTPVVPFAVQHLGADAGVMVTASHNPPRDNGYKVYLDDGAQLVPPHDATIASHIEAAGRSTVALAAEDDPAITHLGAQVVEAYLDVVDQCRLVPSSHGVPTVYTAMHGVGRDMVLTAFRRAGYPAPTEVREQVEPDPDFPTLAFPNPEEPGALDLAIARADSAGIGLVIANDPDADRLGVAVRGPAGWRLLTGNEIGALLGDHILSNTSGDDRLVVTTIVSSRLLSRLAAAAGVHCAETLTGFKWIIRPALDDPTRRFVFGYEEALGYAVSPLVRDKDGVSAALLFVELAGVHAGNGHTVLDRLDHLAVEHGLHTTDTWAIRFDGADATSRMSALMGRMRMSPPSDLAGLSVTAYRDYLNGGDLPPTDAVLLELGERARVLVRPSGTEPKAKCYLEVITPVSRDTLGRGRADAEAMLGRIRSDLARHLGLSTG